MQIRKVAGEFSKSEWINVVENNKHIVSIHEHENSEIKSYGYAILKIEGFIYGVLNWDWEKGKIDIDVKERYLPQVYKALLSIADDLGGYFYYKPKELFDPQKHLPIPAIDINRSKRFFEGHDLDYIRWMAFREEDQGLILETLKLKKSKEVSLKDGIDSCDIIVTPSYSGWIFLIGDNLPDSLVKGNESSSDEALTNLCKTLQKLSKKFIEVQYFEHHGKHNIDGYFKANNGKMIFGYWKTEDEEFKKGRVPKEIKKLHPTSAHEVASVWSIDPMDFIYLKEMVGEKSYVVAPI